MYSREADRHPQRGTGQTTPSPAVPPLKASETRDLCTSPHDGRALLNSARACRRRRVLVDRTSCGCEARAATARITRTRVGSLAVWDAPLAGAPTSGGRTATLTGVGCVGNTGTLHASRAGTGRTIGASLERAPRARRPAPSRVLLSAKIPCPMHISRMLLGGGASCAMPARSLRGAVRGAERDRRRRGARRTAG